MAEEFCTMSECKRTHTLTNWVIGVLFAIIGSLSLATGYSIRTAADASDRTSAVKGDLEVLKTDHQKTTDFIRQTLDDMKNDIKEIRKNTDDLRIKVK